jgi:exonuclease III
MKFFTVGFVFSIFGILSTNLKSVKGAIDTECPNVPLIAEDRRTNTTSFRLVQYNAEWLFLDQYKDCPGSGCSWANESEAMIHFETVSKVLIDLNPDFVNFCEIEGCDELSLMAETVNLSHKPYLLRGTDTATGQNVGFMSRIDPLVTLKRTSDRADYPLPGSTCGYTGVPGNTGVSKHYYTSFKINDVLFAVIAAHLLAFPTDKTRCAEREGQAQVLQRIIMDFIEIGYEVIVMGDFNDFDNETPDDINSKATSRVLDILKGNVGENTGRYQLYTVAELIPQEERYTEWYDQNNNCVVDSKELSSIDHILMTQNLFSKIKNTFMYHDYVQVCGNYQSDHFPVVVDFEF